MSFVQLVSAFRLYRADVLLIALGVMLATSLLKKTVMKTCQKKVFIFLPFGLGLAIYAVYRMAVTASFAPILGEILQTLEGGFGCGCAATLYYVVYEQFFRGKFKANPLLPLMEFVPEARREEAAKALYEGAKELGEEEMRKYFLKTLNTFADPPMSEEELHAATELLVEYMLTLQKK